MLEQTGGHLSQQLAEFNRAVTSFDQVMHYDFSGRNAIEQDIYKNACIQKFKYCTELSWKLAKRFLEEKGGDVATSPKMVYRRFLGDLFIDEETLTALFQTLNDRNLLSRVYKESMFGEVIDRLPVHLDTLKKLLLIIQKAIRE